MQWTSVNDELPEVGFWYLVVCHDGGIPLTVVAFFDSANEEDETVWVGWGVDLESVTHWMPLPNPPEA